MSTFKQLREGLTDTLDTLLDGWQRLYHRAAGAITRFTPGSSDSTELEVRETQDTSKYNAGWGVLAAEVFDDGDKVVVRMETPGMKKEDFDLQVRNNYLIISGEKRIGRERTNGRYHVSECAYGCFERSIPLPGEVESASARASYTKGVLRIELPKPDSQGRESINIEVN
ncbi:MAG: Hsp20/alpha crystallin family protein [Gammaproteobacteria bacterium]|nr:Hsp20/alpha crystallin family protein [Gammaproteobacteria bacterium]